MRKKACGKALAKLKMTNMRRDFEDEARKRGWILGRVTEVPCDRERADYREPDTRHRWEAWQAAAGLYCVANGEQVVP